MRHLNPENGQQYNSFEQFNQFCCWYHTPLHFLQGGAMIGIYLVGFFGCNGLIMAYREVVASVERLLDPTLGIYHSPQRNIDLGFFTTTLLLDSKTIPGALFSILSCKHINPASPDLHSHSTITQNLIHNHYYSNFTNRHAKQTRTSP